MKNKSMLPLLGTLLLASSAYASDSVPPAEQSDVTEVDAYNLGWLAATSFCVDLEIPAQPNPALSSFQDACQDGFAEYVHGDAECVQKLNKWQWAKFWRAITQVCNQETPWDH